VASLSTPSRKILSALKKEHAKIKHLKHKLHEADSKEKRALYKRIIRHQQKETRKRTKSIKRFAHKAGKTIKKYKKRLSHLEHKLHRAESRAERRKIIRRITELKKQLRKLKIIRRFAKSTSGEVRIVKPDDCECCGKEMQKYQDKVQVAVSQMLEMHNNYAKFVAEKIGEKKSSHHKSGYLLI
jgi:Mg2+ and Co2+ transporter CorA